MNDIAMEEIQQLKDFFDWSEMVGFCHHLDLSSYTVRLRTAEILQRERGEGGVRERGEGGVQLFIHVLHVVVHFHNHPMATKVHPQPHPQPHPLALPSSPCRQLSVVDSSCSS